MNPDANVSLSGNFSTVRWKKSVHSGANGACVEVARLAGRHVGVRDSKIVATSPVLPFTPREWQSFLGTVKTGRLDLT